MANRRRSGKNCIGVSDVTLNDFANAPGIGRRRLKKAASDITRSVKDLCIDDVPDQWDEPEEERKFRIRKKSNSETGRGVNVYSVDVWFLISDYIRPEDIGRFSAICKQSYAATNAPCFWFRLYKRFYQKVDALPERLRPECMTSLYELKPRVIRSLYYMYPPFASKYVRPTVLWNELLTKRRCILMWWCKEDEWRFNFKLKRELYYNNYIRNKKRTRQQNFLDMLDDISANQEDGCLLLQISLSDFIVTPPVLGLTLTSIKQNCNNSIQLTFSTGTTPSSNAITTVHFNSVTTVNVHDWWSPQYPHSDKLNIQIRTV